jgi:hypothetical protein
MAWPGNRREKRAVRGGALGYLHRGVGQPPGGYDLTSEGAEPTHGIIPQSYYEPPAPPIITQQTTPQGFPELCKPQRYNEPGFLPGCPVPPGSLRYIERSVNIPAGGTGVFRFDCPGIFCPQRMLIIADDVELMFVTKIATGTKNQLISGSIPAEVYSTLNNCCPLSCLDCMCAPGVVLEINILNTDVTPELVQVVLIGVFNDIPQGMTAKEAAESVKKEFPGCPIPGRDKMVGFTTGPLTGPSNLIVDINIETPGRFCPRQLFFWVPANAPGGREAALTATLIRSLQSTLDEQIIVGNIPAILWSIFNECCVPACLDCLCLPGVPLTITVQTYTDEVNPRIVAGVAIGAYEDVC